MNTCQSLVRSVVSTSFTTEAGPSPATVKSWTSRRSSEKRSAGSGEARDSRYVPAGKKIPALSVARASSIAAWMVARSSVTPSPSAPKAFTSLRVDPVMAMTAGCAPAWRDRAAIVPAATTPTPSAEPRGRLHPWEPVSFVVIAAPPFVCLRRVAWSLSRTYGRRC